MTLCGRARARSSCKRKRALPGALASKGCAALGAQPMRQRVAVAPAGWDEGCVIARQGVRPSPAARLKRRAGVRSISLKTPIASARLCDFKPSSSATSASSARAVSTIRRRAGSRPRRISPAAEGRPSSPASTRGQHHKIHGAPRSALSLETCSTRLTARRSAKPRLAIQAPAIAPETGMAAFTSCRLSVSRPPGKRASAAESSSGQPNCHLALGPDGQRDKGAARSILRMVSRNDPIKASRGAARGSSVFSPGSGTAKGRFAVPAGSASTSGLTKREPRGGRWGKWAA